MASNPPQADRNLAQYLGDQRDWQPKTAEDDADGRLPDLAVLGAVYGDGPWPVPQGNSNAWAIGSDRAAHDRPLIAGDQHLPATAPANFHHAVLASPTFSAQGASLPGLPFILLGNNQSVAWQVTNNSLDVTDVFQETIVVDETSPIGYSTVYQNQKEPIVPIPVEFKVNQIGDGIVNNLALVPPSDNVPEFVLTVPRRNDGPLIDFNPPQTDSDGSGLSAQWAGFSGTTEAEAFYRFGKANDLKDFQDAVPYFDVGSQNVFYSDRAGNIAYFMAGEVPLREDLQAGTVNGLPPFFIREGTGGNEWIPAASSPPSQTLPYETLPPAEMPRAINPPAGLLFNANNDPTGLTLDNDPLNQVRPDGGIYYLNYAYDMGLRAGRIGELLEEAAGGRGNPATFEEMQKIQADTYLPDAEVFLPYLRQAFDRAETAPAGSPLHAAASDPRVQEAMERLEAWDLRTPTGLPAGFDADPPGDQSGGLSEQEVASSIAATIYAVWRGRLINNTVDAALTKEGLPLPDSRDALKAVEHLLDPEIFSENQGVGASGLNFLAVPEHPDLANAAERRDYILVESLRDALEALSGDAFADVFGNATDQDAYRWGYLHRLTLEHPLGGAFNMPPGVGEVPSPLNDLSGLPMDGGFETLDRFSHDARAANSEAFRAPDGRDLPDIASQRYVGELGKPKIRAETSLPGGESGDPNSPFYANLLDDWLVNEAFPLGPREVNGSDDVEIFIPGRGPLQRSAAEGLAVNGNGQAAETIASALERSEGARGGPSKTSIPELRDTAIIARDEKGVPYIFASNESDLFLMQGWVHAEDRLFQIDVARRAAAGTLSELLGKDALAADIEARVIGLERAAEKSWPLFSQEVQSAFEAYSAGINSYLNNNDLPPEYDVLEITEVEPEWRPLDSVMVAKGLTFLLSFDLGDIERSKILGSYIDKLGYENGLALFTEDVFRSAPFTDAATLPDAGSPVPFRDLGAETAGAVEAPSIPSSTEDADRPGGGRRFDFDDLDVDDDAGRFGFALSEAVGAFDPVFV